jgi:hypothetical protein
VVRIQRLLFLARFFICSFHELTMFSLEYFIDWYNNYFLLLSRKILSRILNSLTIFPKISIFPFDWEKLLPVKQVESQNIIIKRIWKKYVHWNIIFRHSEHDKKWIFFCKKTYILLKEHLPILFIKFFWRKMSND